MNFDNFEITYNKDLYDKTKCEKSNLITFINKTKKSIFSPTIQNHRKLLKKNNYNEYLKKRLPKYILEGVYKERCQEELLKFNGLLTFDFDDVSDFDRLKELIIHLFNPLLIFKSCSNDLKVTFYTDLTDINLYEKACKYIISEIQKKLELYKQLENLSYKLDYVGHAVGTYLSFDNDLYYNKNTKQLIVEETAKKLKEDEKQFYINKIQPLIKDKKVKILDNILEFLNKTNQCMTETYDEWSFVGFCLFNSLKQSVAIDYFYAFSCTADKFSEKKFDWKWKDIVDTIKKKQIKNKVTIASLVKTAKEFYGFNSKDMNKFYLVTSILNQNEFKIDVKEISDFDHKKKYIYIGKNKINIDDLCKVKTHNFDILESTDLKMFSYCFGYELPLTKDKIKQKNKEISEKFSIMFKNL